uniref:Uncharacterized protein n=1 Tax=viral metagenome TaxID=1070528 RepID=A0A6C0CIM4_9ZZZZ
MDLLDDLSEEQVEFWLPPSRPPSILTCFEKYVDLPWPFREPKTDSLLDRAERVFKLLRRVGAGLSLHGKIWGASNVPTLVVWLDFPRETSESSLNCFSVICPYNSHEPIAFYGLVRPADEFDPQGKLFLVIRDAGSKQKGKYRWTQIKVTRLLTRVPQTAPESSHKKSKTDHDQE